MLDHHLMLVHAHLDDESSQSPAAVSHYVDEGARVTLATCTLGGLGEILMSEWEHYTLEELGVKRVDELAEALRIVDATDHVWLEGKGRYHDSGMTTDDEGRAIPRDGLSDGAFWAADLLEASDHLVVLIRDRRPQVIVTHDRNGNYGHPDRIRTHCVAMYAAILAGVSSYQPDLGEPWRASRVLWINPNPQAWSRAAEKAHESGMPLFEGMDKEVMRYCFATDPRHIAVVIFYEGCADLCQAVLEVHRSQVGPESPLWKMLRFMRAAEGTGEAYRLVAGVSFPGDGPADDLLAGLGV